MDMHWAAFLVVWLEYQWIFGWPCEGKSPFDGSPLNRAKAMNRILRQLVGHVLRLAGALHLHVNFFLYAYSFLLILHLCSFVKSVRIVLLGLYYYSFSWYLQVMASPDSEWPNFRRWQSNDESGNQPPVDPSITSRDASNSRRSASVADGPLLLSIHGVSNILGKVYGFQDQHNQV